MLLLAGQVEDNHFFVFCVYVFNLVGDESDSYFCEINEEVIPVVSFIEKKIHKAALKIAEKRHLC